MKNVKGIVYAAMFSTLAVVLGLIQIPTPFAPYLAIDGSEIIVLIAGNYFGFGVMGITIILRSVLRWVFGLSTGFFIVGEIAAILSSFILGGLFLLIKKKICKRENVFKLNNFLILVFLILMIPFVYFSLKINENKWLILGMITLFLPIVIYLVFTFIKKELSVKYSKQILSSFGAISVNSIIMTILNFLVITPSNALQKPASFITLLSEFQMSMDAYVYGFILPVLPFNILKGILSVIIFFMIEKTLDKVMKLATNN